MSRSIAQHATLVNTSQSFAVSDVHESDAAELDDCFVAMLIAFFMLLDRWDREVTTQ